MQIQNNCAVYHAYPYSIRKVAAAVAGRIGCPAAGMYSPNSDAKRVVIVTTVQRADLEYAVKLAKRADKCVAYVIAEGVPLRRELGAELSKCYLAAPHEYTASLIEQGGFGQPQVVKHAVLPPPKPPLYITFLRGGVGFIGVNLIRKGIDVFLEVAKARPDLRFRLATTTIGEVKLAQLPGNVLLESVPIGMEGVFYETIDVFLFPSRAEGFSLAPREYALATGVAPIVSDIPVHDDSYMIKCRTADERTVEYHDQLVTMREPDPEDCARRIARVRIDPREVAAKYPISLYDAFKEMLF